MGCGLSVFRVFNGLWMASFSGSHYASAVLRLFHPGFMAYMASYTAIE